MLIDKNDDVVKRAIGMLGGPTKASNVLGVSNGTIHVWIKLGRISDIDMAKKVAELTGIELTKLRSIV